LKKQIANLSGKLRLTEAELADIKEKSISLEHENENLRKELSYF